MRKKRRQDEGEGEQGGGGGRRQIENGDKREEEEEEEKEDENLIRCLSISKLHSTLAIILPFSASVFFSLLLYENINCL